MDIEHIESLYPSDTRNKEIAEIFSYIKTGKSAQLIALPGVGRANVLGFLAYNRNIRIHHTSEKEQVNYHFVLCNFSEIKNRPLFDVMKFIFLELTSSLHERRREEEFLLIDKLFKNALSYNDELVLFQALKDAVELLTLEKNLTVIFLFERFESYIPQVTEQFFINLRSIRNRAKYKFSVVFSTTRPLEDTLEPELFADFHEYVAGNHIFLPIKDDVGLTHRVAYLEKISGKKLPKKTLEEILSLTAGHGKLTRLAMENVLSQETAKPITPEWLLSLRTIQGALLELWNFLTPDEQQDVLHVCKDGYCPSPNPFLQRVGLFIKDQIAIPLFQDFVMDKIRNLPSASLFYDATANIIRQGDRILSDTLTISEFRLLRLLLQKPDSVIDREEMIQAVWSDSKTQEGVSEQALDQLVFRLRKKIEDDPTHPTHIQTVKGRGVKFVA